MHIPTHQDFRFNQKYGGLSHLYWQNTNMGISSLVTWFSGLIVFLVELGKLVYLDLCVNICCIEAVSQSIVAISSKFEHTQVGVYHRY
jgi:hypothetical protein